MSGEGKGGWNKNGRNKLPRDFLVDASKDFAYLGYRINQRRPDMKIITRREAKDEGLTRYFTGKPCKHGHIAERYTSNMLCVECVREYKRKYYAENRGAYLERSHKYYAENRDAVLERERKRRAEDPEAVREYERKWRGENRDHLREYNREYKRKWRARRSLTA